jgi:hypothetical protein
MIPKKKIMPVTIILNLHKNHPLFFNNLLVKMML